MSTTTTLKHFSPEDVSEIKSILARYPDHRSGILPALHYTQDKVGFLSTEVVNELSVITEIPAAEIKSVIQFYTLFRKSKTGRYIIEVCATLPCALCGSNNILDYIRDKLEIDVGETTPDGRFTLLKAECLGNCDRAPVMQINLKDYDNLTEEKIDEILRSCT